MIFLFTTLTRPFKAIAIRNDVIFVNRLLWQVTCKSRGRMMRNLKAAVNVGSVEGFWLQLPNLKRFRCFCMKKTQRNPC